mgnify:CR=1 FL=1
MSKVIVGISGGVDSSYTLHLLKKEGHEVIAVYLNMLGNREDEDKARKCAEEMDSRFVSIDCKDLFSEKVKEYFKNEYVAGRTPNPCVVCNKEVKIKLLYDMLEDFRADFIATGHYAKVCYDERTERYSIGISDDITKDQSYMLWMLDQNVLSKLILPLGTVIKSELRKNAGIIGLSSAASKDSTDVCFIPDGNHASWLEKNGAMLQCGHFIHADGRNLGDSKPIYNYTIGQRKGLGLAMDKSVYVTGIDSNNSVVTVDYQEGLYKNLFKVDNLNYVGIKDHVDLNMPIYVKIRYKAKIQKCKVCFDGEICVVNAVDGESFKAVAPGQSAVFYDENGHILFGGLICSLGK